MWSLTFRLMVTSARTRVGQFSPMLGLATSTTVKATMGWAIRAQPPNTTPPYSDCLKTKEVHDYSNKKWLFPNFCQVKLVRRNTNLVTKLWHLITLISKLKKKIKSRYIENTFNRMNRQIWSNEEKGSREEYPTYPGRKKYNSIFVRVEAFCQRIIIIIIKYKNTKYYYYYYNLDYYNNSYPFPLCIKIVSTVCILCI